MRIVSLFAGAVAVSVAALTFCDTSAHAAETPAKAILSQALADQAAGDLPAAVARYSIALKDAGIDAHNQAIAYYNRGLALQDAGASSLAIDDFTRALRIEPGVAQFWFSRANVLRANNQPLFAIRDYDEALRLGFSQTHLALYGKALAVEAAGARDEAKTLLRAALKVKPGFTQVREALAALGIAAAGPAAVVPAPEPAPGTAAAIARLSDVPNDLDLIAPRVASLPPAVRPPRHLLEAAEMVETSSIPLPGLTTLAVARTPAITEPGIVVAEARVRQKLQDRIAASDDERLPAANLVRVVPASGNGDDAGTMVQSPKKLPVTPLAEAAPAPARIAAVEPAPAPAEAVTGWTIQLNAQPSEAQAWKVWDKVKAKQAALLARADAYVATGTRDGTSAVYRLRIKGFGTAADAQRLCDQLKSRGTACFVVKAGA